MTLHPVLQNLRADMRDECASPGTIWASIMTSGSQGIMILHVCIDMLTFPFGRILLIGRRAVCMLPAAVPLMRKWPAQLPSPT